jgi:hypothetical protein
MVFVWKNKQFEHFSLKPSSIFPLPTDITKFLVTFFTPCEILKEICSIKISTLINFNGLFASLSQVLTKDSVTVSVDAVVYYRVNNATISIANVENAHHSTRLLAQTTLRNTMGTRHLHEILSERMTISGGMQVRLTNHSLNKKPFEIENTSSHLSRPLWINYCDYRTKIIGG